MIFEMVILTYIFKVCIYEVFVAGHSAIICVNDW